MDYDDESSWRYPMPSNNQRTERKIQQIPPNKIKKLTNTRVDEKSTNKEEVTQEMDSNLRYFLYFIHKKNIKSSGPVKIGTSNNVRETIERLQEGRDTDLKCHAVIKCTNGDADAVLSELQIQYNDVLIQRDWYELTKTQINENVANLITRGYELVSEAKAKAANSKHK